MLTLSSTVRARRLILKNVGGFCSRKSVLQLISKRSLVGYKLVDFSPKNSLSFGLQVTNNPIRLFSSADTIELIGENTFGNKEIKYDWNGVMDKTLVDSLRNYNVEEFTTSIGELGKMNVIGSQFSQELLDTIHDVTMAQLQKFDKTQTSIVFHGLGALRIEFSTFSTAEQQDILALLTRYLPKMNLDEAARLFFGLAHMRVNFGRIPYSFKKATETMLLKQSSETDKSTVIANIVQSLGIMQFKWTNVSVDAKKDSLASNLERHFKNLPSDKFVEALYGFARWGVKLERVPTGLKNLLMEEGAKHMAQTTEPSDYYIVAKIMTSFHLLGVKFRSLSMTAKCNYLSCLQNTLPHLNGNKFIAMLDLLAKSEISFSQLSSKFMEPIRLAVQDGLIRNAEAFMNTEHFSNVFYSIGIMEWQFYSFPPEFKTTLETAMSTHIPLMGPRDLMRFLYGVNHMGFQSYAYLPATWIKLLDESLLKNLPLMTPHEAQSTICSLAFMKAKPRHFDFKTLLALDLAAVTSYDQLFKTSQKVKMLTAMGAIGLDYVRMSKELRDLLHTTIANKNNEEIRADILQDFIISLKGYDMKAHHFGKKLVQVPQPTPITIDIATIDATIPATTGNENLTSDQTNSIPDVEISTSAQEKSVSATENSVSPKEYLYDRGLALEKLIASHLHNFNEVQTVTVLETLADIGLSTVVFGKDFEQAVAQHIVRLYTGVKTTENVNSSNDTYFNNNSVDNNNNSNNDNSNNNSNNNNSINSSKKHTKDVAKLNIEEARKQAIADKHGNDNDGKKYINKMINVLGRLKFDWFMFDPAQRKQITDVLITTNLGYIHVLSQTLHGFANIDGWYNTFDHAFRDRLLASTANITFKYNEKNNKINLESANSFSTILSSFGRINTPFFDLPREEIQEVIVKLFGHKGSKLPYTPKDVANVIRALADMDASWNELTLECRAVLSEAVKGMDSYGVADVMHAVSVLTFDTPFAEVKALHTDLLKLFERHRITQFTDNNHINKQNIQNCVPYFELLGSTQEGRDLVQETLGYTPSLKAKSEKLPGGIQMAVISRLNRRLKQISPLYSVKTPFPGLKSLLFPLNAAVFYDQNLVAFVDLSEKRFYYDVKNTVDTDVRRVDLFKYHLYDLQYDNIPVHCMKVDQMVEQEKAKPASVSWNFAQLFDAHRHEEQ